MKLITRRNFETVDFIVEGKRSTVKRICIIEGIFPTGRDLKNQKWSYVSHVSDS